MTETNTVRLRRVIAAKPEKNRAFLEADAVIPLEACYPGWQESRCNLARLVEPEITD